MKSKVGLAIIISAICFLVGCDTTTSPPDINSLQPTQQQLNQQKLQSALQN